MNKIKWNKLLLIVFIFSLMIVIGCKKNKNTTTEKPTTTLTDKPTERQTDKHTETPTDKPTDKLTTEHIHSWDEGEITTPPTCTTKGVKTFTCSGCEETRTEEVDELGHNLVDDEAVAPTCTETGKEAGKHCSRCDYTEGGAVVAALGHTEVVDVAVAPTCTETGKTEGKHCSVCNTALVPQETVPALGHSWNDGVVTLEPTCTTKGIKTYTCSRCSETNNDDIAELGHDLVSDAEVAPTCLNVGKTAGHHCSRCDYTDGSETISALGHSWNDGVITLEPTCLDKGVKTFTCSRCNLTKQEDVDALGHDLIDDEAILPTCTSKGRTAGHHCSRCDYTDGKEEVDALGHQNVSHVAGKCSIIENELGNVDYYECSVCKDAWADENMTVYIGNTLTDPDKFIVPYSVYSYKLDDSLLVPYYDSEHDVAFKTSLVANTTSIIKVLGPKITDVNVKSISFYIKNDSSFALTVRVVNNNLSEVYKTSTPQSQGGYTKITVPVECYNSVIVNNEYGLGISVSTSKTGDNGSFLLTRMEFDYVTNEELNAVDQLLNNINIIDDVTNSEYIKTFIQANKDFDAIRDILISSRPTGLTNYQKMIEYYDWFDNYKYVYDANNKLFMIDVMSSANISGISKTTINDLSFCKITVNKDTNTLAFRTPDFENSIKAKPYVIFRVYNPTDYKVSLNLYGTSQYDDPLKTINLYPKTWETIIFETSLYTSGNYMYMSLTSSNEESIKGDWLFSSILHYAGNKAIIYGQSSDHKMTIYKANWKEADRSMKDERMVFKCNLVGTNTDSTAITSLSRIDSNLYSHVEFYIYIMIQAMI